MHNLIASPSSLRSAYYIILKSNYAAKGKCHPARSGNSGPDVNYSPHLSSIAGHREALAQPGLCARDEICRLLSFPFPSQHLDPKLSCLVGND